jgi:hypothetical protein
MMRNKKPRPMKYTDRGRLTNDEGADSSPLALYQSEAGYAAAVLFPSPKRYRVIKRMVNTSTIGCSGDGHCSRAQKADKHRVYGSETMVLTNSFPGNVHVLEQRALALSCERATSWSNVTQFEDQKSSTDFTSREER